MNDTILQKIQTAVDGYINNITNEMNLSATVMTDDFNRFFRTLASRHYINARMLYLLGSLRAELGADGADVHEIIASVLHFYEQKLLSLPSIPQTTCFMHNVAELLDREVNHHMYVRLKKFSQLCGD